MELLLNRRRILSGNEDEVIMTSSSNPEVIAICYANAWCASPNEMYKSEAKRILTVGNVFNSSNIVSFEEFRYFTSITKLNDSAFNSCSSLTKISIPKSVNYIDSNCFRYCYALESVDLLMPSLNLRANAFADCTSLKSIVLPTITDGLRNNTFKNCSALENVVIPEGLTSILYQVFTNCYALESIILPKTLVSIGNEAFSNCKKLSTLYVKASTAPDITYNTFSNTGIEASTRTLYVNNSSIGYDDGHWLTLQTRTTAPFTLEIIRNKSNNQQ